MNNPKQFTDADQFNSEIPESAVQQVNTRTYWGEVGNGETTFASWLYDNGHFQSEEVEITRINVSVFDPEDESFYDLIGYGEYCVDPNTKKSAINGIYVGQVYQQRGYGTQIKKTVENHLSQENQTVQFTAIVSEGGCALLEDYDYEYVEQLTEDTEIYRKEIS
jgi:RimJ/RimL family protein N-acetyltransferase